MVFVKANLEEEEEGASPKESVDISTGRVWSDSSFEF